MTADRPALSIVIASLNPGQVIFECLSALESQREQGVEVVVADASADGTADRIRSKYPWARVLNVPDAHSLPRLRGAGMADAVAPVIGILDPWCLVGSTWIADAIRAHEERRELVIGGGVELEQLERRSFKAWATYLR